MVRDDGAVLLERRPPAGIWGGLWTLPQFDEPQSIPGAAALPPYFHSFTHFDLTLQPLLVRATSIPHVDDTERYCWYDPRQPARIGLTKPTVDLIRAL
jgi:A/G-specific adenine glycosylase